MRFQIGEKVYDVGAINKASLTDLLNLKKFTGLTLDQLQAGHAKLDQFDNVAEAMSDMDALMSLAAAIWLARWKAGDGLNLEEACDFPLDEMVILPDPGDEKPQETADPE